MTEVMQDPIWVSMDGRGGKTVLDLAATCTAFGVWLDWLPTIGAVLSLLWLLTRFYEYVRWLCGGRKGPRAED